MPIGFQNLSSNIDRVESEEKMMKNRHYAFMIARQGMENYAHFKDDL